MEIKRSFLGSLSTFAVCYIFLQFIHIVRSFENDLTVAIQAGQTECFYVPVKKETELEIEFQVLDGGDLDINFYIMDPNQRMLAAQTKKSEASHKFTIKELGDYRICFDNSFSHFSRKLVYFEVMSTADDEEKNSLPNLTDMNQVDGDNELVDVTVAIFQAVIKKVRTNLERANQLQSVIKNHEARDRNIQEANFERVNNWSVLLLFVMVSVGLVQVLMIRNFFQSPRGGYKAQT